MKESVGLWKKGDVVILVLALLVCLCSLITLLLPSPPLRRVTVTVGGKLYGVYDLGKEQVLEIRQEGGGYNRILMGPEGVRMVEASCPDHTCVHQGLLSRDGAIICLPNQVTIRGETGNTDAPDMIVG